MRFKEVVIPRLGTVIPPKAQPTVERTEAQVRKELYAAMKTYAQDYPVYVDVKHRVASSILPLKNASGKLVESNRKYLAKSAAAREYFSSFESTFFPAEQSTVSQNFRSLKLGKKYERLANGNRVMPINDSAPKDLSSARAEYIRANADFQKDKKELSVGEKKFLDKTAKEIELLVNIRQEVIGGKMIGLADHIKNLKNKIQSLRLELSKLQNQNK